MYAAKASSNASSNASSIFESTGEERYAQRVVQFDDENKSLFTILNIIAHDPIHDYGSTSNKSRWNKNTNIVKKFLTDSLTINNEYKGGMMKEEDGRKEKRPRGDKEDDSEVIDNTKKMRTNVSAAAYTEPMDGLSSPRSTQKSPPSTPTSNNLSQESLYDNKNEYNNAINEMVNDVNTSIIFLLFQAVIEQWGRRKKDINSLNVNGSIIEKMLDLIKPSQLGEGSIDVDEPQKGGGLEEDYTNILTEIITDLQKEVPREVEVPKTENLFNQISHWLSRKNEIIKNKIINAIFTQKEIKDESGKMEEFTADQSAAPSDDFKYFTEETEPTEIKEIKEKIETEIKEQEAIKNEKKQKYDKRLKVLYSINPVNSTNISEWVTETNKQFNITLFYPKEDPIRETIKKTYEEKLEEGYIKNIAPIDGKIKDLKKKKNATQKEIENLESGQLSKEEIRIRGNFCSFIAKSGLYLTKVCNKNGFKTYGFKDLHPKNIYNNLLNTQIDILLYQSGWNNGEGNINTGQLDNELFNFYSKSRSSAASLFAVKASSQDNHLFTKIPQGDKRYFGPKHGSNKYIVNNAAPINNTYTFCPYSSVLDGMSNCSSSTTTYERGNMDFTIVGPEPNNIYYNGKLSVNPTHTDTTVKLEFEVGLNIKLNGDDKLKIKGEKSNINMNNANNLEAYNVLKNTLVNIINFIENPFNFIAPKTILIIPTGTGTGTLQKKKSDIRSVQDYILDTNNYTLTDEEQPPSNIFDNLFNIFVLNPNLFNKVVHSEILFKVLGDLFQEINSLCKYGGYTGENYETTDDVIKYNMLPGGGDTIRGFFANDRPSAIRFLYMLQHATKDSINQQAYGGYYSSSKGKITELIGDALPISVSYNGGFPIKKTQKSKQTRKRTKNKHPKKTKNAKRKNNSKTRKHKKKIIRRNTRKSNKSR